MDYNNYNTNLAFYYSLKKKSQVMNTQNILEATFTNFTKGENWVSGIVKNTDIKFNAKLFDEGSEYGINSGRVSKLSIKSLNGTIINYDRGWDIEPTENSRDAYEAVMFLLENAPKLF